MRLGESFADFIQSRRTLECSALAAEQAAQAVEKWDRGSVDKKEARRRKWKAFVKKDMDRPRAILKTSFRRLSRDLLPKEYRLSAEALDCLHQATEAAMQQVMKEGSMIMAHCNRTELYPKDFLQKLRPDDVCFAGWKPVGPSAPRARSSLKPLAGRTCVSEPFVEKLNILFASSAGEMMDSVELGPEDD